MKACLGELFTAACGQERLLEAEPLDHRRLQSPHLAEQGQIKTEQSRTDHTPAESQNDPGLSDGTGNLVARWERGYVTVDHLIDCQTFCLGNRTNSLPTVRTFGFHDRLAYLILEAYIDFCSTMRDRAQC